MRQIPGRIAVPVLLSLFRRIEQRLDCSPNDSMTHHVLGRLVHETRLLAGVLARDRTFLLTPTAARAQFGLFGSGIVFDAGRSARMTTDRTGRAGNESRAAHAL